jgi:hypothetical protein
MIWQLDFQFWRKLDRFRRALQFRLYDGPSFNVLQNYRRAARRFNFMLSTF